MEQYQFTALIAGMLAEHPEWINAALQGITEGSAMALRAAQDRAADKDQAMMAALTLASNTRLGPELVAVLRNRVAQSINQAAPCQIEKDFLATNAASRRGTRGSDERDQLDNIFG